MSFLVGIAIITVGDQAGILVGGGNFDAAFLARTDHHIADVLDDVVRRRRALCNRARVCTAAKARRTIVADGGLAAARVRHRTFVVFAAVLDGERAVVGDGVPNSFARIIRVAQNNDRPGFGSFPKIF